MLISAKKIRIRITKDSKKEKIIKLRIAMRQSTKMKMRRMKMLKRLRILIAHNNKSTKKMIFLNHSRINKMQEWLFTGCLLTSMKIIILGESNITIWYLESKCSIINQLYFIFIICFIFLNLWSWVDHLPSTSIENMTLELINGLSYS